LSRPHNAIITSLDKALINHALKSLISILILHHLFLSLLQFFLKLINTLKLVLNRLLSNDFLHLIIFNFLLRATPFRANLHKHAASALRFYNKIIKNKNSRNNRKYKSLYIRLIAVLALKAAAIFGSNKMFKSFSIASYWFRSWHLYSTQVPNKDPSRVKITLHI
jgi:hypothetical protein